MTNAYHGGQFAAINSAKLLNGEAFGAVELHQASQRHVTRSDNETLNDLIGEWMGSPEWARYSSETQRVHRTSIRKIQARYGKVPLAVIDDPRVHAHLMRWRATLAHTPAATDNLFSVMSSLLNYGVSMGKLRVNVATGIGDLYRLGRRAMITWQEREIALVVQKAEEVGRPEIGDAVSLAALSALRLGDLIRAAWHHVHDARIVMKLQKRARGKKPIAVIPRDDQIDSLLVKLRSRHRNAGVTTLLVNQHGDPWRHFNLDIGFRAIRKLCGIGYIDAFTGQFEPKHLHDLRGTKATNLLAQDGLSDAEVASFMGWSEEYVRSIRPVYVDEQTRIAGVARRAIDEASRSAHLISF